MAKGYIPDRQSARRISDAVRKIEREGISLTGRRRRERQSSDGWYQFKNNGSQDIPGFAVMRVESSTVSIPGNKHRKLLKCSRPDTTFSRIYAVNGPLTVKQGQNGLCRLPPFDNVEVLYDTTSGTPALGEGWGPKPDSFKLSKNYPCTAIAVAVLSDLEGSETMLAHWGPIEVIIGKLAGSLSQGSTATVNVWAGAGGSEAVISSMTVTARDWLMKSGATAIASGKKVVVKWINGVPYVVEAECA